MKVACRLDAVTDKQLLMTLITGWDTNDYNCLGLWNKERAGKSAVSLGFQRHKN
jgi:hypothetical protein